MSNKLGLFFATVVLVFSSFFVAVSPVAAETVTVRMGSDNRMLVFQPSQVKISAGDTVKWVNNYLPPHNVVFDTASEYNHKEPLVSLGESFESTFNKPGEYTYVCEPHRFAGMVGKIIVE
jgi:plastocyanin